jgi:hypothetical protein
MAATMPMVGWEWKKVRFVEENGQGWHTKKAKALDVVAETET